jgi:tetratricopeptide (TPR) repeat protein
MAHGSNRAKDHNVETDAEMYGQAVKNHQAGNFQLAEQLYRQIIQVYPSHVDAWCFLGVACQSQGKLAEAETTLRRAVDLLPAHPSAGSFLGAVLLQQGRPAEAVAAFQQAMSFHPNNAEIQSNLGIAFAALGSALAVQARVHDAVECYRQAAHFRPQDARMHYLLGVALAKLQRFDEAIAEYERALRLNPSLSEAHNNLGFVLQSQGRVGESIAHWRTALRLHPDSPEVLNNLGNAVQSQGQLEEAIAYYQQALHKRPQFAAAYNNLANVLRNAGRLEEAVAHWHNALRIQADYPEPHYNLGKELQRLGKLDDAAAHYQEALRLKPDYSEARWNRALLWLLLGDFKRGWAEYELRWTQPDFSRRSFMQPRWDGLALAGRTILLHAEQGLGDTLHFIRYASLVQAQGGKVIVDCQPALLRLLSNAAGIDKLVPQGTPLPSFDVEAPLLSLPGIFRTSLETIPATVPYVRADEALVEHWRREMADLAPCPSTPASNLRIGISWQGSPTFHGDRERSMPLAKFAPLAKVLGVRLISLQKGPGTEQLKSDVRSPASDVKKPALDIEHRPSNIERLVLDLGSRLDETFGPFMDTAAIMMGLDLVISSDSAIAHLAGALGIPVWVAISFVPDWRWLLQREDSPWYPTMRLFRQSRHGQWDDVFDQMAEELTTIRII